MSVPTLQVSDEISPLVDLHSNFQIAGNPFLMASRKNNVELNNDPPPSDLISSKSKKKRRVNRPGFNSYLKVLLDEHTIKGFHKISIQVRDKIAELEQLKNMDTIPSSEKDNGSTTQVYQDEGKSQQPPTKMEETRKPLRFKPRSEISLHMTLFFCGEVLCELSEEELSTWHQRLSVRLKQSGFTLGSDIVYSDNLPPEDFSFRFKGLKVFPPRRNNLVVAILEAGPAWDALYNDIQEISGDESVSKTLADITRYSKNKWVSHITLGNLYGGSKAEIRSLDLVLQEICGRSLSAPNKETDATSLSEPNVVGIGMGGPTPEQVDLDWNFQYSQGGTADNPG